MDSFTKHYLKLFGFYNLIICFKRMNVLTDKYVFNLILVLLIVENEIDRMAILKLAE